MRKRIGKQTEVAVEIGFGPATAMCNLSDEIKKRDKRKAKKKPSKKNESGKKKQRKEQKPDKNNKKNTKKTNRQKKKTDKIKPEALSVFLLGIWI